MSASLETIGVDQESRTWETGSLQELTSGRTCADPEPWLRDDETVMLKLKKAAILLRLRCESRQKREVNEENAER